jgi:hypothetical protein
MSNNSSSTKTIIALAAIGGMYYIYQKHKQHIVENPGSGIYVPNTCQTSNTNHDPTQPPNQEVIQDIKDNVSPSQGFIANIENQPFPAYRGGGIIPFF